MFLAEELEASGLWSSETYSRLELGQRGQTGSGWGPGREVQADQEVAENSLGVYPVAFDLALLEAFHRESPAWWPGCSS